jgi:hypothetical protein
VLDKDNLIIDLISFINKHKLSNKDNVDLAFQDYFNDISTVRQDIDLCYHLILKTDFDIDFMPNNVLQCISKNPDYCYSILCTLILRNNYVFPSCLIDGTN